jgi:class 3 adenylate cyclase
VNDVPLPTGTVTFLFSDIEDSTELVRRVGNEAFATIRTDHRRMLRSAFTAHGGIEIDTAGDGFFVAFDSARAAVEAAIEGQRALAQFAWPEGSEVRVRMGLHTAEPHLGDDGYVGVGITRAARICDAGRGGQILVSNATAGIVEDAELPGVDIVDLGEHKLKGLLVEQRLFQLSAPGLLSAFAAPRTADAPAVTPGAGTFLLADLTKWRNVIRTVGDEASAALLAEYHALATSLVAGHGGTILELTGDTVVAVFRSASDAVLAAAALRAAVHEYTWPPGCDVLVSTALHSGRWSGDPRHPRAGTAISRVFDLGRTGDPGQTLVSASTAALVEGDPEIPALRSIGERTLPGLDRPMLVFELAEP